jgi:hypothetical protein
MRVFSETGVNIEYLYVSLERTAENAVIIFKVADIDRGTRVLKDHHFSLVSRW